MMEEEAVFEATEGDALHTPTKMGFGLDEVPGERPSGRDAGGEASGEGSEQSSDDVCAICFEQCPFISLPCKCNVNYCKGCWSRALATSVTVRGIAQCPSCRTNFRVDFDTETTNLVFTPDDKGTGSKEWRSRLYCKARPAQIQCLRNYGEAMQRQSTAAMAMP